MAKKTTSETNHPIRELTDLMFAADRAAQQAKGTFLAYFRANLEVKDEVYINELVATGYREKKAKNMVTSYRKLATGAAPEES